jgi:hypothetical protein
MEFLRNDNSLRLTVSVSGTVSQKKCSAESRRYAKNQGVQPATAGASQGFRSTNHIIPGTRKAAV